MAEEMEDTPAVLHMTLLSLDGAVIEETETSDTPEELLYAGSTFVRADVSATHVVYQEVPGEVSAGGEEAPRV